MRRTVKETAGNKVETTWAPLGWDADIPPWDADIPAWDANIPPWDTNTTAWDAAIVRPDNNGGTTAKTRLKPGPVRARLSRRNPVAEVPNDPRSDEGARHGRAS